LEEVLSHHNADEDNGCWPLSLYLYQQRFLSRERKETTPTITRNPTHHSVNLGDVQIQK